MDKPVSMLQREFKDNLVSTINNSKLPAFVLVPIVEQALRELERLEQEQYDADKVAYENQLMESEVEDLG